MLGSDPGDVISQKRWLAFLEGGLLPIISLTSLHFFTKYDRNRSEDGIDTTNEIKEVPPITESDRDISNEEYEQIVQDFVRKQKEQDEKLKYTPTEEDVKKLDEFLRNLNYDRPTKEEVDIDSIKYTPTDEELNKIEELLSKFSQPEPVEIKEEDEVLNNEIIEGEIITQEIEKVDENVEQQQNTGQNKVLNYYKNR
jgi:hypothetical protein